MGVCRQILRHPHDADDAFQATFLVLVRKARSIRVRESLAPWLYSVAYRTAQRARASASRYRQGDVAGRGSRRSSCRGRLSPRSPAPAPRRARSPSRQVPDADRALPPRRQDPRRGGAAAALAGRHGQRPALARSGAPQVAPRTAGLGGSLGNLLRFLVEPGPVRYRISLVESTLTAATRFATAQSVSTSVLSLDPRSLENHVAEQTEDGLTASLVLLFGAVAGGAGVWARWTPRMRRRSPYKARMRRRPRRQARHRTNQRRLVRAIRAKYPSYVPFRRYSPGDPEGE